MKLSAHIRVPSLDELKIVTGVILSDHVKSLDWKARLAERIARVPKATLDEAVARLAPLLGS